MTDFADHVALVTGAGSGIGRACALLFARRGARVMVSDMDEAGGAQTVRAITEAGGEARFLAADVSAPAQVEALIRGVLDAWGRLDAAVNNAGIGGPQHPTADYPIEAWQRVLAINLSGVFYCCKHEIPAMARGGGGAIVNMGSILSSVAFPTAPAYVAAKHGVLGLTRTAAIEYAQAGVRVNAVGPAFIHTPMVAALEQDPQQRDLLVSLHPMGRLGQPEEVAALTVWLCSQEASFCTGGYYLVDGGYVAR
jgi:NAD(P)-dependent dehydrogenase (short-subunit alcohol dehydrogenase family)